MVGQNILSENSTCCSAESSEFIPKLTMDSRIHDTTCDLDSKIHHTTRNLTICIEVSEEEEVLLTAHQVSLNSCDLG